MSDILPIEKEWLEVEKERLKEATECFELENKKFLLAKVVAERLFFR